MSRISETSRDSLKTHAYLSLDRATLLTMREGKPGGGKGPLLSVEVSLTMTTGNTQILFWNPGHELASGLEGSPVRISASPEGEEASMHPDPDSPGHSLTLWSDTDLKPSSSKTSRASSPPMPVETLGVSSMKWGNSGMGGPTGFSTANGSECPSDEDGCSSSPSTLTDILTPTAPARFSLSARAAEGIIRRSAKRGRRLPAELDEALKSCARQSPANGQSSPADQPETNTTTWSMGTVFNPTAGTRGLQDSQHTSPSLKVGTGVGVPWSPAVTSPVVRRLTPLECERLMGWPDHHTLAESYRTRRELPMHLKQKRKKSL